MTAPNLAVIVNPGPHGVVLDDDGNPVAAGGGGPTTIYARAIAPGDTRLTPGATSDLDEVAFTAYFNLGDPIADNNMVMVRGRLCRARVKEWVSPWSGRGGLEVACISATGATP
jgi:hypothetical protein